MELFKFNNSSLLYTKINKPLYLLKYIGITLGICLAVGIFSSMQYVQNEKVRLVKSELIVNLITNESFSRQKFFNEIERSRFKYPDIIKAQALIESQHFSSPVWKENNNALGMRLPNQRFTLAVGDNLEHAVYLNWKDCIKDRLIYEAVYLNDLTKDQYFSYLDRVYARAKGKTQYSDLIKTIIRQKNF
jgi:hypothetical protein